MTCINVFYLKNYVGQDVSNVAHHLKYDESLRKNIAYVFKQRFDFTNAILIPVPSSMGYAADTLDLANKISSITHVPVFDVLKGNKRQSQYIRKKHGNPLTIHEIGIRQIHELPANKHIILLDNVVDSGTTALAAIEALGTGSLLSYALSNVNRSKGISVNGTKI